MEWIFCKVIVKDKSLSHCFWIERTLSISFFDFHFFIFRFSFFSQNLWERLPRDIQWAWHRSQRTSSLQERQPAQQQQQQHDFKLCVRHWGHQVLVPVWREREESPAQSPQSAFNGNLVFWDFEKTYSGDPITELVQYWNSWYKSSYWMVWFSNGFLLPDD